jgi:addiction module HigA family antidote
MDDRALANAIDLPVMQIREIVRGSRAMTAGIALKLASYFETTPEFWLNLQAAYDRGKEE